MRPVSFARLFPLSCGSLLACASCDPALEVSGLVLRAGAAVNAASVTLVCPQAMRASVPRAATTNESGAFAMHGVGCLSDDCLLRVSVDGGQTEVGTKGFCTGRLRACGQSGCSTVRATIGVGAYERGSR